MQRLDWVLVMGVAIALIPIPLLWLRSRPQSRLQRIRRLPFALFLFSFETLALSALSIWVVGRFGSLLGDRVLDALLFPLIGLAAAPFLLDLAAIMVNAWQDERHSRVMHGMPSDEG